MAIVLSDNIQVNAPKPGDSRYLNITVPYTSCSQVNTCLVAGVRFTGLTVNIAGVEYWYNCGIADSCLVIKSQSSTGSTGGGTITGATNGLSVTGKNIKLGGTLTGDTTICGNGLYNLCLTGLKNFNVAYSGASTITDSNTSPRGLQYAGNYCSTYIARSLVDAAYVTGKTSTSGIQTANNGLTKLGTNVVLGGTLTGSTIISGAQLLTLGDLNGVTLSTANDTDIGLNAKSCGSIYIKSQTGICPTGNDFCNAVGISASICAIGGFAVYDNRTGSTQTGIVYAGDYSTNYVARSLTDKAYVDSVATGLNIHQAVLAATTSGITLSGNSQTIDGVAVTTIISVNNRILVKNQSSGATNGIYSASTGTWGRTSDYDNSPSGEVTNGDLIPVTSGNTQSNSLWALATPNPIIINVTPLIFTEFSRITGVVAGNGICVTQSGGNNIVSVQLSPGASGLCFDGTGLELDFTTFTSGLTSVSEKVYVNASQSAISGTEIPVKFNATCYLVVDSCNIGTLSEFTITGNSSNTGFTITHNKNKTFVDVQIVKNTAPYPTIYTYVSRPTVNTVCVTFDIAPTTGQQYKILITS